MPTASSPLTRRAALRSLGVSAAALPFVPLLESTAGGPETPPQRFLVFFHPHGTIRDNWLPVGSQTNFSLPSILEPLTPFADRMIVVDGLRVVPSGPPGGAHTVGPAWVFTGSPMQDGDEFLHPAVGTPHGWASSASIDQVIAAHIGQQTAFASLELGVQPGGVHPGSRLSYNADGSPRTPEASPHLLFESLFGAAGIDVQEAAALEAQRLSVIDRIKDELDVLSAKVSADDASKIDAHLQALRDMEKSLQADYDCTPPELGEPVQLWSFDQTRAISRQQIDLLTEALACQVTNVASVMYRRGENDAAPYPFLGIDDEHHLTTHAADSDESARQALSTIYRFYAEELSYLCQRLDSIVEPDGSTVLDNTIILWGSEIAKGNNHSWDDMPFVLMGGGQGALDAGRFIQVPGQNHCRLMTALCNAFGMARQSFGGFDDGSGPLTEILT